MKIKNLDKTFLERIASALDTEFDVVVGDADGADAAIQEYLFKRGAKGVTVYCSGSTPRNNLGGWNTKNVFPSAGAGTRAFYTAKDLEMAAAADYGLMMWDSKSTGTLSNVLEMLRRGKKSVVFVKKSKDFVTVKDSESARHLVSRMAETSRAKADQKIGINSQLRALSQEQFALPL
jgi:hypothetical protein